MIKQSLSLLAFLLVSTSTLIAQNIAVGEWRTHMPYNDIYQVAQGKDVIYASSEYGLYSLDKVDGSIEILSKFTGFSDVGVAVMKYNPDKDILAIVYNNLNIDLVKNGNEIVNIKDVLRYTVSGLKQVNDIYFYEDDMYVSTSFGIIVINLDKDETKESFLNIGTGGAQININNVSVFGDSIYAATDNGVRAANKNKLLSDFNNWRTVHTTLKTTRLITFNNKLYADIDSVLNVYDGTNWQLFDTDEKIGTVTLDVYFNKLFVAQSSSPQKSGAIFIEDVNGTREKQNVNVINDAMLRENGDIYYGTNISGLIIYNKSLGQEFYVTPNGPPTISSFGMYYTPGELWVTSGGFETQLFAPAFNNGGFFRFVSNQWTGKSNDPQLADVRDLTYITQSPANGHMFFASHLNGLIEYFKGTVVNIFDFANSPLAEFGNGWTIIGGLAFDDDDNLWVTNYKANNDTALHMITPSGKFYSFKAPNSALSQIIIDDFGQKWMVVRRGGGVGIAVFTDNDEPDNPQVHEWKLLNTFPGNGGLPTIDVTYLAKDKDGEIWVGTNEGIAVFFNPGNVFQPNRNFDASRIIITDGEFANYLLGNEVINTIVVDGGNRKWVGTNSGVWLLSPDGTETIHQFNTDNSPLPSNSVNSIGIDEKTGEVFFGTANGIVSYRGDATEAEDTHGDVIVFPNPVRPEHTGVITISGLPTDAYVKITDLSGNLVYETSANGGTATWNGRNFNGDRPKTGIYLVFTSNEDGDDTNVAKILFVN